MSDVIDQMIANAKVAQKEFETFSQEQVDAIVRAVGKAIYDNAEELARDTIDETEMGKYEDKAIKNKNKVLSTWNYLKDKKSIGVIEEKNSEGIVKIAKPVGIVGAVTPSSNPIITPVCNAMQALKGGNAIIVATHPRAKNCDTKAIDLMIAEIKKLGAPDNLIQCISEPSIELASELMGAVDVLVATGGPGMVNAAYSSGKPSYGVGPGNVQVIIDNDVDYSDAALTIINGRKFDNGLACSSEQSIIVLKKDYDEVITAFKEQGAFYIDDQDKADRFRAVLFPDGNLAKEVVGKSAQAIAELAGVEIPENITVIVIKSNGAIDDVLRKEKMCPVMVAFEYDTFEEAISIASSNLEIAGKGHTCAIHSNNAQHIEQAGLSLPVSRIVINEIALTAGGSLQNGFAPTATLGCGSWGNNSISENLDYKHLVNIQRIGYKQVDKVVPSDEEIWSEA